MGFSARLSAPSTTDKNWVHTSYGGKNSCIHIGGGSVLPNCVGYAWGRFMEVLGSTPKLSRGNAEDWYGYNDGYERGSTPKLGAVAVWAKGKVGNVNDGAGHVAVVEQINSDGSIVLSNSDYGGRRFYTLSLKKPYTINGFTFLGFIYNPVAVGNIGYKSHMANVGWDLKWRYDGELSGTTKQNRQIEAIMIQVSILPESVRKVASVKLHMQGIGWKTYSNLTDSTVIGTTGQNRQIEAISLNLPGYEFRVHQQNIGWTSWTECDGISSQGSVGQSLQLEAIQIRKKK